MATFFERYKFKHPRPEDFFAVVDEVSGREMGWFWDEVYYSSSSFDYAIASAKSQPLDIEGLVGDEGALELRSRGGETAGETPTYRSEVVARRNGGSKFPMEILLVFEDGSEARHAWDGKARWTLIVEERTSRLSHAIIDPDEILLLDIDRSNNSYTLKPEAGFLADKLAAKWIVWLQDFLSTFAFFS